MIDPGGHYQARSPSASEHSGPNSMTCRGRFGEFLAAAGVSAYSPSEGSGHPDFEQATGAFVPEVHVLYGMAYSRERRGDDGPLRVERGEPGDPAAALSKLAEAALTQGKSETVGVVLDRRDRGISWHCIAAIAGGHRGRRDRHLRTHQGTRLAFLTSEPEHARSTALVVGVATRGSSPALAPFVRPLSGTGPPDLKGHFHAAVVPYRPLPRGSFELAPVVQLLFEPGRVETVLHLLGDSRPIVGAGESTFNRGVFWVVPLADGGGIGPS